MTYIKTICPYCGCGCGLVLAVSGGRVVRTIPDRDHPVSRGQLCIKGWNAHEFIHHPDRLTAPLLKKNSRFTEISWDLALGIMIQKFQKIKQMHGPDALAGFSSARCSNEENYLFQKLIRTGFGTNNVDHCARLCHGPTATAMARAFGSGAMTGSIPDLSGSDLVIMFGSNAAETHPIIMGEIYRAKARCACLIVVDPRMTEPARNADIHLPVNPGADIPLINGIMKAILDQGLEKKEFIRSHTTGFEQVKQNLESWSMEKASGLSGIDPGRIIQVAQKYARAENAAIVFCMGITQHTCGTSNVHALCNLAMLCNQVGRPHAGVHPLRGQNNVQGACDMGALPDVLPGYQNFNNPGIRADFENSWNAALPPGPGLTITEVTQAAGKTIHGLYIMAENPMMSDPDISHLKSCLEKLDFLVVQDLFMTQTAQLADLVLPGACFAEKDGTFTSTDRRVQRLRKAVEPPGRAMDDFSILCRLGQAMGLDFKYQQPGDVMEEMAQLIPIYRGINFMRLEKNGIQWPCPDRDHPGTACLHQGKFARGKGLFVVPEYHPPAELPEKSFPMTLITGRMFAHYHTGTMTRRSQTLCREINRAYVEIHPKDAAELNIRTKEYIRISTRRGAVRVQARLTSRVGRGTLFLPFHFFEAPANELTHDIVDPVAKIPEFKVCAAKIEKEPQSDAAGA